MEREATPKAATVKERAVEEFRAYWISALYLWLFLGAFTVYRRLILAESGVTYLHYGIALIEALVIAKVVLIGRMFGFSRRFDDKPLIVPVIYKSILFGAMAMLFGVLEHLVDALFHHTGIAGVVQELAALGVDELAARIIILIVAFVPFFAFWEIGRVIGMRKLATLFFSPRNATAATISGSD